MGFNAIGYELGLLLRRASFVLGTARCIAFKIVWLLCLVPWALMCQVYFSWFHGCSVVPSKLGFDMPLVHLLGLEFFVGGVTGLADMTSSIR